MEDEDYFCFETNEFPVTDEAELKAIVAGAWTSRHSDVKTTKRSTPYGRVWTIFGEGSIHTTDDMGKEGDDIDFMKQIAKIVPEGNVVHLRWTGHGFCGDISSGVVTALNGKVTFTSLDNIEKAHVVELTK